MKALKLAAPPILFALALSVAHSKPKKSDVPAVFQNAKFVYVQALDGDVLKPDLFPEDRQAIYDVEDSLRAWKRYVIVLNREQADLVFVVRKGRLAAVQPQVGVSTGPRTQPRQGPGQFPTQGTATEVGVRTEVGEPDDMLRVFVQTDGELKNLVWNRMMDGGLDAPAVQLMKQLQQAVEKAYPQQPPAKKQP